MDELKLRIGTLFMKNKLASLLAGFVRKKTGIASDIQLNELEIGTDDGKIHIHASIDAELSNEELFKLLGSL